jgi:hypothetical protein
LGGHDARKAESGFFEQFTILMLSPLSTSGNCKHDDVEHLSRVRCIPRRENHLYNQQSCTDEVIE